MVMSVEACDTCVPPNRGLLWGNSQRVSNEAGKPLPFQDISFLVAGNRENGFTSDRLNGLPDFVNNPFLASETYFFIGYVYGAITAIQGVPNPAPTPEPATLLLVSSGAVAAFRRRRRITAQTMSGEGASGSCGQASR